LPNLIGISIAPAEWEARLHRDVKEIVGALMRVLDGGEVSESELADLGFEAEGELETAVNEAYVRLGEFAQALDIRLSDPDIDGRMRAELQTCLDAIVDICDRQEAIRKH
jgi:hypothetical protein